MQRFIEKLEIYFPGGKKQTYVVGEKSDTFGWKVCEIQEKETGVFVITFSSLSDGDDIKDQQEVVGGYPFSYIRRPV